MARNEVRIRITGDPTALGAATAQAEGMLAAFQAKAAATGAKLRSVGKTMTLGVTLPVVGLGVAAVAAAGDFDDAYDTIRSGTGATGADLEELKDVFRDVVKDVPASFEDASTAVADLNTRLGLTGGDLEHVAEQSLELSRITGTDLSRNIESTSRVMGDWGRTGEDIASGLDYLFRASQATGIGVTELSEQMVKFGAPMRQLGFDFETSAALLGQFEKEGVNAELVMGSMRIALGKMARDGEPAVETFQRVVGEIEGAGSASEANAKALELFGARAGPDMAAAIREGRFEVDELVSTLSESGESILGVAEDTKDWRQQLTELKNRVLVALEPLLMKLFDAVGSVAERVGPMIERLVDWFTNLSPTVQKVIGVVVALAAAAGPLVWVIGGLVTAIAAVASPVGLVVAGLAALTAGVIALYRGNDGFREWVDNVARAIRDGIAAAVDWFVTNVWPRLQEAFAWLRDVGLPAAVAAFEWLGEKAGPVLADIGEFVEALVDRVTAAVSGLVETMLPVWEGVWNAALKVIEVVWPVIKGQIEAAIKVVRGVIQTVTALIKGDWSAVWDGIRTIVAGVWDGIRRLVGAALRGVQWVVSGALRAISGTWSNIWGGISRTARSVWDGITSTIRNAMGGAQFVVGAALGAIGGLFRGVRSTISGALSGLASVVSAPFRAAAGAIRSVWNSTIGGRGISIPDIPGLPGRGQRFEIPRLHSGGVVPGLPGQEVLTILQAGETVRTERQEAALRRSTGHTPASVVQVNVTLNGPVARDSEQWVMDTIERAVAAGHRAPRLKKAMA